MNYLNYLHMSTEAELTCALTILAIKEVIGDDLESLQYINTVDDPLFDIVWDALTL